MASALKKIVSNPHFRRRVSVEEQRAEKHDRFLRGRQIACMIYDHFRVTGACDAAQDLSDLFNVYSRGDHIQVSFDTRWDQALLTASEIPTENVLEGLYKLQIRDSVQLWTVLASYEAINKLTTMVGRHMDQMMRTRNFRARRIETGVLVKSSKKGREVSVERKVGECHQLDSVQEETLVVSATEPIVDRKHHRIFKGTCTNSSCDLFGILPYVKITHLNLDDNSAINVCSDTLRLMSSAAKKSKKGGGKGSVALLKESKQLGCVSQD